MQWWCTWYPGAEPGGGGYIAQRMFSTKSDKDAVKSTLLFNLAHYVIRPWPWIIVALCAMLIFPEMSYRFKGEEGTVIKVFDSSVLIALGDDTNEEIIYEHISPLVKEGDIVKKGDPLFIMEVMKTEVHHDSPVDGKVIKVNVVNDQEGIDPNTVAIVIE